MAARAMGRRWITIGTSTRVVMSHCASSPVGARYIIPGGSLRSAKGGEVTRAAEWLSRRKRMVYHRVPHVMLCAATLESA